MRIEQVTERSLEEVLPLIEEYQRFYRVTPDPAANRRHFGGLLTRPGEGVQFVARAERGELLGFATLYFPLSSLKPGRTCLLNDLYTREGQRNQGVGAALISHCLEWAYRQGYGRLEWQTERTNERAQRLYRRFPAPRSEWITYSCPTPPSAIPYSGKSPDKEPACPELPEGADSQNP